VPRTSFRISRLVLIALPLFSLVALGWFQVARTVETLTDAAITVYQKTELEIVRGLARSIEYYVSSRVTTGAVDANAMEQEMFRLFVDPVILLKNGDAWIYAPDHVVYDESSDFPALYRGKSMAEIFGIQRGSGAWHYEEMTEAVMHARPGTGWYVWLPEKGREIAAWTPARFGTYVWTIGLSTPLPEILESAGVARQIFNSILEMSLGTATALVFLLIWTLTERRRWREERLTTAQKDLSTALSSLLDLDQGLDLCLGAASDLSSVESAAILIKDVRTGRLAVKKSVGRVELLTPEIADGMPAPLAPRYVPEALLPLSGWITGRDARKGRLAVIPLAHGSIAFGCLAAASRGWAPFPRQTRRALESVAALTAGMVLRMRAEDSLKESEQRFRSVVDTAADAIVTVDESGSIVFWSKGAERTFGRHWGDALGTAFEAMFVPPAEDASREEGASLVRRTGIKGNGERFPAELSSAHWAGSSGAFVTYIVRDRSEQERAEREHRELELKLQRAQRMESLGTLAGGVAHDLNNLLTPLIGYTDLLLADVDEKDGMYEPLTMLRGVGERAGAVVQDLLTLGRKGPHQMSPLDLNAVLDSFRESPDFGDIAAKHPRVIVDWEREPRQLPISGSLSHLLKACQNLVLNACETMPQGGTLRIRTGTRELAERHVGYETVAPGAYAVVEFADTGTGIEARDLEHIFEPFYTKKRMGRSGTGLGLAVVYGVVHDHGGRVDVRTEPGKGTTLTLWFPLAAEAVAAETPHAAAGLRGTERIMIVEDQPEQRAMAARLLTRAGYTVLAAEHGHAAVELLKRERVDIMLLDMIMEDSFDGLDCYREAIAVRPGQKAIIVSGFAETERVTEALRLGAGAFLRKPYRMNALLQAIRAELERA
jgi:PAS domain S-box-containing protein